MNAEPKRVPIEWRVARIGDARVDFPANRVQRDGNDVRVTPKAMAVLRELVARAGVPVRRDDLLGLVWRDGFPTDDVLTHAVTELRRALEADPRAPQLIETVPRIGYRFAGTATALDAEPKLTVRHDEPPQPAFEPAAASRRDPSRRELTPKHTNRATALAAIALVIAGIAIGYVYRSMRADVDVPVATAAPTEPAAPTGALATNVRALSLGADRETFPSLSPDGANVVYVSSSYEGDGTTIYVKNLAADAQPRVFSASPKDRRDDFPAWSPDGTRIAFLRFSPDTCEIRVAPATGGESRRVGICRPQIVDYFDWSPDGRAILMTRFRERRGGAPSVAVVHRLDLATGELREMRYTPSDTDSDIQPRPSPDGRWLAFRRGAAPYSDLWIAPYTGGEPRRLTLLKSRMRGFAWYPDSTSLVISSDHEGRQALYRITLEDGKLEPLGVFDAHFPSVARHQPVAVVQQETMLHQLVESEVATDAPGRLVAPSTRSDGSPRYSPDGSKLAFVSARSGDAQLWIHDTATATTHQVTRHEQLEVAMPRWSPDGTKLLHVARGNGRSRLAIIDIDSGRMRDVGKPDENIRFGSWSRDGAYIDYASDAGGRWQAWRVPVAGGEPVRLSEEEAIDPQDALGDGHVYFTREHERGLFRVSLADRTVERVSDSVGYFNLAAWDLRPEGLYFMAAHGETGDWALFRETIGPDAQAKPELLRVAGMVGAPAMALSPDATRLVTVRTTREETGLVALDLRLR